MKKFLLIIIFSLLTIIGNSQITHQKWKVENKGEWGSFYWGVTRAEYPDYNGKYFYYVYCYSNSYFNSKRDNYNYDKATTYISGINLSMKEYKTDYYGTLKYSTTVDVHIEYATCDWTHAPKYYVAWFTSTSPYNKFYFNYKKASAFDYSIY